METNTVKKLEYVDFEEIQIEHPLGRGSFGEVYKAKWKNKDGIKTIAVKRLNRTDETEKVFHREVMLLSQVKHERIITFYGISRNKDQTLHILLEYADRCSLYEFLHAEKYSKIKISFNAKLNWMLQCAQGVAYLHEKNILHRDLKTANILLFENYQLKICDFGTVKEIASQMTVDTGTVTYMAPEVIEGKKYNEKCDVYSYGIIFWEVMSRKKPFYEYKDFPTITIKNLVFENKRPSIADMKIYSTSKHIPSIIKSCWHHNPENRPTMKGLTFTLAIDPYSTDCTKIHQIKPLPVLGGDDFEETA